jgi:hypothetical protein
MAVLLLEARNQLSCIHIVQLPVHDQHIRPCSRQGVVHDSKQLFPGIGRLRTPPQRTGHGHQWFRGDIAGFGNQQRQAT